MPTTPRGEKLRPASWSELRDLTGIDAERTMPAEYARLVSPDANAPIAEAVRIERPRDPGPRAVDAHRPDWRAWSTRPHPGRRPRPPRLLHRGREVDPLWVWGADDRRIYFDPDHYPWSCVCRVVTESGVGSGVLIGPRHVLTASHCIDWDRLKIRVDVHCAGTYRLAHGWSRRVWRYTEIRQADAETVDEDYAIVELPEYLGDALGYMGAMTYESRWDDEPYWFNIGYPADIAGGLYPTWQRDRRLDEDEIDYGGGRAMTTSADLTRGNSGGPMFGFFEGLPYVVAVVSAEGNGVFAGRENYCAGGNDLTYLVKYVRANAP